MASLDVLQSHERAPKTLTLLKRTTTFGRDPSCDVTLKWDGCSRRHFSIVGEAPDGSALPTEWLLEDEGTGTNNGVFVNGRRVSRVALRDGDVIGVGRGRDVPEGGKISDRNLEYVYQLRKMPDPGVKAQAAKGRLEENLADKGMHRQLRGQSRHPLGGHKVSGDQKVAREHRAEFAPGITFAPCRALVYAPSRYKPSRADNEPPQSSLQLEYVYGIRSHDTQGVLHFVDEEHLLYPAGAFVIMHELSTNTQSFFMDHDDDVVALTIHPNKRIAASGQVSLSLFLSLPPSTSPSISIWLDLYLSLPTSAYLDLYQSRSLNPTKP